MLLLTMSIPQQPQSNRHKDTMVHLVCYLMLSRPERIRRYFHCKAHAMILQSVQISSVLARSSSTTSEFTSADERLA